MPLYDALCAACEYHGHEIISLAELDNWKIPFPLCKTEGTYRRVIMKAPFTRVGGEGSPRQIYDMKRSLNERFVKKDLADVRHKFGKAFDDSLVGAAVDRIKKEKPEG